MSSSKPTNGPDEAAAAARYLESRLGNPPAIAILIGTGLGELANAVDRPESIDYGQIPHFPNATAPTHAGRLVWGKLAERPVLVLEGRFHLYEGYHPLAVAFPIRVLQSLGVRTLVQTNAAGGLNPDLAAGDIMIIADHVNMTGDNPLIGANEEQWGPRFPDMTAAYTRRLRTLAVEQARVMGLELKEGVYAGLKGPSLETAAEMRLLKTIGADAVGFSTVMETIAAVHAGMQVLGLSTITNVCRPDRPSPASVKEIVAVARSAAPRLAALIAAVIERAGDA